MSVGVALTKAGIDSRAGNLAWQLIDTLDKIHDYRLRLDSYTEEVLVGLGYTSGEVATLKSAFTKMDQGGAIMRGEQALATPENLLTFAYQLIADLV